MQDLVWDDVLSVGVDEIDEDHCRLVELFNLLNHSIAEGADQPYVEAVFEELINCTVWHFSHEERLMIRHAFPEYLQHRSEHRSLIKSVRKLQQKYLQTGEFGEREFESLERWLTGHILVPDMRFGAFLAEIT